MSIIKKSNLFIEFDDNELCKQPWQITNDAVMGGLSWGNIKIENHMLVFSGYVSIENNGGFTSVFSKADTLLEDFNNITIRVLGDGKHYQFRVRSQVMGFELAYKSEFETTPKVITTHSFKLSDFKPVFRGRSLNNAPLLKSNTLSHIGFLIKANQACDFSLSIHSIIFDKR